MRTKREIAQIELQRLEGELGKLDQKISNLEAPTYHSLEMQEHERQAALAFHNAKRAEVEARIRDLRAGLKEDPDQAATTEDDFEQKTNYHWVRIRNWKNKARGGPATLPFIDDTGSAAAANQ